MDVCAIREAILRSRVIIYTVANRFRNFARTCLFFFINRGFANSDRSLRAAIVTRHIESFLCPSTPCHPIAAGYTCLAERDVSIAVRFCASSHRPIGLLASSRFEHGDALRRAEEAARMEGGLRGRN